MEKYIGIFVLFTFCLLLQAITVHAQQKTVSGTVTDAQTDSTLAGVNILVVGTSTGTATDADGHYELQVKSLQDTLRFSFIGYKTKRIPIHGQTTIDAALSPSVISGQQMVVVGYGKQKKENLTSSVTQVNGDKLENLPITNLGEGLQGLVPNLNVDVNSGEPGQGASYNIRGITSINGGSPLVLVDGVQMDPNLVNPDNVESVTVLKDAASSAIYGARAAYGVVLIKTKSPKNKGLNVTLSSSVTMNRPAKLSKTVNSVNYVNMHRLANRNGLKTGGSTSTRPFTEEDSLKTLQYFQNPKDHSPVYVDSTRSNELYQYVGNTNWRKVEYPGYAPQTNQNLTISGGNGQTSYLASLGYIYQKGTAKPNNERFKRINPTLKLNSQVASWLNFNFKATLHHTKRNRPTLNYINGPSSIITNDVRPVMPVRHPDGNFSGQGQYTNMVAVAKQNGRNISDANDLWFIGGFNLDPINHLTIKGKVSWNTYKSNNIKHWKEFAEYGANGVFIDYYPWTTPNAVEKDNEHDNFTKIQVHAQYYNTFGKNHITGMIGYSQQVKKINGFHAHVTNLIDQDLPTININTDNKPSVGDNITSWALEGYFFRLNYRWNSKYLIELNGRYDGSSKFPANNRYVFSPSVSVGWRVSQEKFFEPIKHIINNLKVRVSYGRLANQSISSNFPYLPELPVGTTDYIFGDQIKPSVGAPGLVNPNFTWEKVYSKDVGIDFSMFQNRLHTDFSYYIRQTKGMLVAGQPLPAVLGASAPTRNAANLKTKGWGLDIKWHQRFNKNLSLNVGLNLSNNNSYITKYDLNPHKVFSNYYPGYHFGQIWGYVTNGFFQTDQQAQQTDESLLYAGQLKAGDIRYKDLNGDDKISPGNNSLENPGDRRIIGNSEPHYRFGLNLSITYKNFDFSTFLRGVGKKDFMPASSNGYFWPFPSEWTIPSRATANNYWTPQNRHAYFPTLRFGGGGNFQPQTRYLQNAAYMRVKYITLGYSLSASLLQDIGIRNFRIYITGKNLFTLTDLYPAFDPEILGAQTYPINKAYSFGLQIKF
jgi:TonB-linked SusC/RagA family outer membrane protein